ncbi:helix-turn-helix domain-containing protein [Streptomyces globisporus]|uniref:helix-turn-helix domain-containing protein n=1 Tax=Streptomyces globisporus TaxID=1908 RepID=UPI0036FD6923
MGLARDALRTGIRSISEMAAATGYESERAFSTAFRRMVGASPRCFRDRHANRQGADSRRSAHTAAPGTSGCGVVQPTSPGVAPRWGPARRTGPHRMPTRCSCGGLRKWRRSAAGRRGALPDVTCSRCWRSPGP